MSGRAARQRRRVGVQRIAVEQIRGRGLDDLPGVHDRGAVAHRGGQLEVVGDEQHRQAALAAQLVEDRHHLGLRGDVERGRRLVGEQQPGLARAATVAIITRCSMPPDSSCGILLQPPLAVVDADLARSACGRAARIASSRTPCSAQGLGHEVADPPDRVDVRARDPGRSSPTSLAVAAQRPAAAAEHVAAVEADRPGDLRARPAAAGRSRAPSSTCPSRTRRPGRRPRPRRRSARRRAARAAARLPPGSRASSARSRAARSCPRRATTVGRRSSTSNHGRARLERRADAERGHVVVRCAPRSARRWARRCRRTPTARPARGSGS